MERAEILAAFDAVAHGTGTILCVSGEPGIGKTTIVEDVLAELSVSGRTPYIARGRCSERLAGAEAYLPWLETLESLLQTSRPGSGPSMIASGESAARLMKVVAPTWYVQVAPLAADDSSAERLRSDVKAASQERMKRELGAFCQEVSRLRPLVLFFDDIHWADASTVDLIAYLATRLASMHILLVVTYRPSELALSQHPFGPLKLDLQGRGVCREIGLDFLSREDVERYVTLEFPEHRFPADFPTLVHARTDGSPLFMVDLLRDLRERDVIVREQSRWTLARAVPVLARDLPVSVRSMIQRKIDRLADNDRRLLIAASVQGAEFDAAVVARALALDAGEVEERLDALDRIHTFVRRVSEHEFPDRTVTLRYRFVHVLYQNALYNSLTPARRASLSAAVAHALLHCYGEQSSAVASELGFLFEAAREFGPAVDHFSATAQKAAALNANHEAIVLARRALALLETMPDAPQRAEKELALQLTLGPALIATTGFGAPDVEAAYARAKELCEKVGQTSEAFPVRFGLWGYYQERGALEVARELAEGLLRIAENTGDSALLVMARRALGENLMFLGQFAHALEHLEQVRHSFDPERERSLALSYGHDPVVYSRTFEANVLWLLGHPDRALQTTHETLVLARGLSHPFSLVLALAVAGLLHSLRRDSHAMLLRAEEAIEMSREHGFPQGLAFGGVLRGRALFNDGNVEEGIEEMRQAIAAWADTGAEVAKPYWLALLAEALGRAGEAGEGLTTLDVALATVEKNSERFCEAELQRLKGELLLAHAACRQVGAVDADMLTQMEPSVIAEAETCFRQAIEIARRQQARSWELRATTSLSRLYLKQGRRPEARQILARIYGWFTEGFDTADLRDAKTLLEELSSD